MSLLSHFTRELKLVGLYDTSSKLTDVLLDFAKNVDQQELTKYDLLRIKLIIEKLVKKEPLTPFTGVS